MAWTWEEMLSNFRALGGTADNIVQSEGRYGRGIFPVDRTRPIHLRVPENLLIPQSDVEFVDDRLRIRESAQFGQAEREFFEKYENTFSWGGSGRSDCAALVQMLDDLPPDILAELSPEEEKKLKSGNNSSRIQERFLRSRRIDRHGKIVIMPLMELVNHGHAVPSFNLADGIAIEGIFSGEVLVRYSDLDPLDIFLGYGFASPAQMAFSLPAQREGTRRLIIERNINFNSRRGSFSVPDFKVDEDAVRLSCVMIGNSRAPRLSKGIFCHVMREAGWANAEEEFDIVVSNNRISLLRLLELLDPHRGGLIQTLRKVVRYQLEAISYCIGTREL